MILEILIAVLLGLLFGTITGLIPGIHINLVALLLVGAYTASELLANIPGIALAAFVTSLAVTHSFIDFIPSVFLGAPNEDNFLSVLPGHQMLKEGLGFQAIILTVYGSLFAILVILVFTPIFIYLVPFLYENNIFLTAIPFLLIFVSLFVVLRDKNIIRSLTIFILAGILGFVALQLPIDQPLLPLLTGLFGASAILVSLKDTVNIAPQKIQKLREIKIPKKELMKAVGASLIAAPASAFLPGMGAGHAAVIGSEIISQSRKGFLVLIGAINTIVIGLSFITLFAIEKTRTGAAVAVKEIMQDISINELFTLLGVIVGTSIGAFFLTVFLAKKAAIYMPKINYRILAIIVLAIIITVIIIFSNPLGLIVFVTATGLGIFTILSGARRINMMGVLLIPTILFYLFF